MNQRQSFNLFTTHLLNERASGGSVDAHFELIAVCQSYLTPSKMDLVRWERACNLLASQLHSAVEM